MKEGGGERGAERSSVTLQCESRTPICCCAEHAYTSILSYGVHELQCMHSLSTAHLISAVCAVVVAAIAAGTTSIVSQTTTISITADHTVVTVVVTTCYCCCHAAACYHQCAATITAPAAVFDAPAPGTSSCSHFHYYYHRHKPLTTSLHYPASSLTTWTC